MILYSDSLCYFFQIAKAWQVLKKSYCNCHTCYINRWTNTKMYFGSSKPQHTYRFLHDSLEGNLNELNDFINDYFIYNLKLFTILIKRDRLVWNFSLLWTTTLFTSFPDTAFVNMTADDTGGGMHPNTNSLKSQPKFSDTNPPLLLPNLSLLKRVFMT